MRWAGLALFVTLPACGQDLGAALAAASPTGVKWVGYEVAMQPGNGMVCKNWQGGWNSGVSSRQTKIMLDGAKTLRVLFRVDSGKVEKMTLASDECEIDAGSQLVMMLPGVSAEASVRYLAKREDDTAMYAISLHRDPLATETLIALARDGSNAKRQKRAFFWLARSKDPKADEFIGRLLR